MGTREVSSFSVSFIFRTLPFASACSLMRQTHSACSGQKQSPCAEVCQVISTSVNVEEQRVPGSPGAGPRTLDAENVLERQNGHANGGGVGHRWKHGGRDVSVGTGRGDR